jgi:hypothetical protein
MPGVWEEVHSMKEHHSLSIKKPFGIDREGSMAAGLRCRRIRIRRSIWCPGDHDSDLVVPQWDAGQEAARTLHERIRADPCPVGRALGECEALDAGYVGLDWTACDVTTKITPVIQVGGRTQEMAYHVVHE